ncbi:MAG: hypothetical protein ACLVBQ_05750, partial [Ruminococcus callidus]
MRAKLIGGLYAVFPKETLSGHDVQRAFFGFFACGTVGRGFLKIQGNTAQRASGDFARHLLA